MTMDKAPQGAAGTTATSTAAEQGAVFSEGHGAESTQGNTSSKQTTHASRRPSWNGMRILDELLDDHEVPNPEAVHEPALIEEALEDESQLFLRDDLAFEQVGDRISEFQEDEFVKQALAKGMDLREYAHHIESELDLVGQDHEDDYIHQSQAFVDLHGQIQSCDEILETMENLLSIFQTDLGNISTEIQTLQTKSVSMSVQLKNRMAVESQLNELLEGIMVTPFLIRKICDGDVDDTWLVALVDLNHKMHNAKAQSNSGRHIRALKEVGPELERLRLKAVEKIREFLLSKIKTFKVPNTNVQIMQHSVLLKYKELNQFLMERHSDAAAEIRQTYDNTLKWYFSNQFEHYHTGLEKLQSVIGDKYEMLCTDENAKKGLFGTTKALHEKTNVFTLGNRIDTLRNYDAGLILPHVAQEKNIKYPYEALFRSFNLALIDNASSEYLFLKEYFTRQSSAMFWTSTTATAAASAAAKTAEEEARAKDQESVGSVFTHIFEPTTRLGLTSIKEYAESSFDAIGILLCLRINHQLSQELLQRRKITFKFFEKYFDAVNMILWPRFQAVMDLHIESVRKARTKGKMGQAIKNVHPHWVARRYGEFVGSLWILNDEQQQLQQQYHHQQQQQSTVAGQGGNANSTTGMMSMDVVGPRLAMLRMETSSLFDSMSKVFPDIKNRLIFLINTYDLVLTLLSGGGNVVTYSSTSAATTGTSSSGPPNSGGSINNGNLSGLQSSTPTPSTSTATIASTAVPSPPGIEVEMDHWRSALSQTISLFVEEELKPYFGDLISFIKMVDISGGVSKVSLDHFERSSFLFAQNWRSHLSGINTSVIQHFSSFKNGTQVLHQVLGQLIVYYTRFHSLLDEKLHLARVEQQNLSGNTPTLSSAATTVGSTRGWGHQPVGVQTVMIEVKKFRSNFN